MGLDAKRFSILTLTELEATTSLGLTGLLTLNGTGVASHEAFSTKSLLVISIDFHECTGNSEAKCLALTSETTTTEGYLNVVLFSNVQKSKGLLYNKLQDGRGKILSEISLVNGNFTCTFGYVDTGDGALTTA